MGPASTRSLTFFLRLPPGLPNVSLRLFAVFALHVKTLSSQHAQHALAFRPAVLEWSLPVGGFRFSFLTLASIITPAVGFVSSIHYLPRSNITSKCIDASSRSRRNRMDPASAKSCNSSWFNKMQKCRPNFAKCLFYWAGDRFLTRSIISMASPRQNAIPRIVVIRISHCLPLPVMASMTV